MIRCESVKMFLRESLNNYKEENKINFSLLHAITAVELALKEKLHKIHPQLIYSDIDSPKKNTIILSKIINRLKNFGVEFCDENKQLIEKVAGWRNDLIHNIPIYNERDAKITIGKLFNFLFSFLNTELHLNVSE